MSQRRCQGGSKSWFIIFFLIGAQWPNPNVLRSKVVFYVIFNETCQYDYEK